MEMTDYQDVDVNEENLESFLLENVAFVQFFNSFLSLPEKGIPQDVDVKNQTFPQRLVYNVVTGLFEQFQNTLADDVNGEGNVIEAAHLKARFSFFKSTIDEKRRRIGYYVKFHDKEEGLAWVQKFRLPLFLKSEIYADFKLSCLLSVAQEKSISQDVDVKNQTEFLKKLLDDQVNISHRTPPKNCHSSLSSLRTPSPPSSTTSLGNVKTDISLPDQIDSPEDSYSSTSSSSVGSSQPKDNKHTMPLWQQNEIRKRESLIYDNKPIEKFNDYRTTTWQSHHELYHVSEEDEENLSESFRENLSESFRSDTVNSEEIHEDIETNQHDSCYEESLIEPPDKLTKENVKMFSALLSRRQSVEDIKKTMEDNSDKLPVIDGDDTAINKVLGAVDHLRVDTASDMMTHFMQDYSSFFPLNLAYKQALDAFKEFLFDTPGEKNILLWLEVMRSKYYKQEERKRLLTTLKERFIHAGSPHEIPKTFLQSWGLADISSLSIERLIFIRRKIADPLLKYWVQRFTLHQYREKKKFLNQAVTTVFKCHVNRNENLPQRPKSCMNHIRVENKNDTSFKDNLSDTDSGICVSEKSFASQETGLTRRKMRTKSAYPRLMVTKQVQLTNVGAEQLELVSSNQDEGFGFQPSHLKFFQNDASDNEYKKSVRLYIQPVPSFNAVASTLTSTPTMLESMKGDSSSLQMDELIECLLHEQHSGGFFLHYLKQQNNQMWLNCYHFWKCLQEYNEYFFAQTFQPLVIKRKANKIFTTYVQSGAENAIDCPVEVQTKIYKQLDPPYEDLFDVAEHHALDLLLQPWLKMSNEEVTQYDQLKLEQQLKFIEVNRRQTYNLNDELGELNSDGEKSDDSDSEDKISPEEISQPLPLSKDSFNFQELLRDKTEMEFFQAFLETRHKQGITDLTAWTDMEVFRRLPRAETKEQHEARDAKAKEIRTKWLNKEYFFGNDTPASKHARQLILDASEAENILPNRPSSPTILEAQKYSRARVERRWLLLFKQTKDYLDRRKKRSSVSELVEDLLMKKKLQRNEQAWRLLNSRWNPSSREVTALRLALSNSRECEYLRRFVSVRGEMMEQNFNFWLEVQKYKDLCHSHVEENIIKTKVETLMNVFIKSSIPPELQIDIPLEMAERLQEKVTAKAVGPYLFREAQATVFRIIYNFWKDFQLFRDKLHDGQTMGSALAELEKVYQDEIQKKKMAHERKRLGKLVNDNKRRSYIMKERERSKQNDLFSLMAKSIAPTEVGSTIDTTPSGAVTSFHYSKHNAEDDLLELEERMKERGFLIYNEDSHTLQTMSRHCSIGRDSSVISRTTRLTTNRSGARATAQRRFSFFNTTGAMEMMKMSFGDAFDQTVENRTRAKRESILDDFDNRSRFTRRSRGPSVSFQVGDGGGFRSSTIKRRKSVLKNDFLKPKASFDAKSSQMGFDKASCVTDLNKVDRQEMRRAHARLDSKNKGNTLTKKSLKEFEKSPQGKPLPILRINQSSFYGGNSAVDMHGLASAVSSKTGKTETQKGKKSIPEYRLPRNAGTAAILKKREFEREKANESPPPEIMAEVVVC